MSGDEGDLLSGQVSEGREDVKPAFLEMQGFSESSEVESETCSPTWMFGSGKAGKLGGCLGQRQELCVTLSKPCHELPCNPEYASAHL